MEPCWNRTGTFMEPYLAKPGGILEPWWNRRGTFLKPAQTNSKKFVSPVEPSSGAQRAGGTCGTLVEPYLKPPRTEPSQMVEPWWNPRGSLMERETFLKLARTTPQRLKELLEPWWNPGGTLVEPYLKPSRATLCSSGGTFVELTSNHPDHPAACHSEPWWNG